MRKRAIRYSALQAACLSVLLLFPAGTKAWTTGRLTLNGFSSLECGLPLESAGDVSPRPEFNADIVNLLFNYRIRENLRAALDASWKHEFDRDKLPGRFDLRFGFLEYTVTDEARLRGGIILTPFGLFNEIHYAKPAYHSIDVPLIYRPPRWFAPAGFSTFPAAATGLSIQGETNFDYGKELNYNLFIANGIQEKEAYPYFTDGNLSKSVTLRMRFFPAEQLRLGKSFYIDFPDDHISRLLFSDGYELELTLGDYLFQAEGILSTRFPCKSVSDKAQKQLGIAVHTSRGFSVGLTPYLRFEYLDPDLGAGHDASAATLGGVAWETPLGALIKLETDYYFFGSAGGGGTMEVKAAFILAF